MTRLLTQSLIFVAVLASLSAAARMAYVEYHHNWPMFALAVLVIVAWIAAAALVAATRNSD